MEYRYFGSLGKISVLTLGGGGIGTLSSATSRAEAVATVHAAIDAGITMIDVASGSGPDQVAESVVGEALRGRGSPDTGGVMVATKVELSDHEPGDVVEQLTRSLHASLERLGRGYVDLFVLHSRLQSSMQDATTGRALGWATYVDQVIPTFHALREELLIRGWGLTGAGHPAAVLDALDTTPRPDALRTAVDTSHVSRDTLPSVWPRTGVIVRAAALRVPVMAVSALAPMSSGTVPGQVVDLYGPAYTDRRHVASQILASGMSSASLALRYTLAVPGVATAVINPENRTQLAEFLKAQRHGPLTEHEMRAVKEPQLCEQA